MWKIVSMFGLLALSTTATAENGLCRDGTPDNLFEKGRPVRECVRKKTVLFERSKERAGDVATAAVAQCETEIFKLKSYIESCDGLRSAISVTDAVRQRLHEEAIGKVVAIRAGVKP